MSTLEKAIVFATQAHSGQKGKDGLPYILHPLRVMLKVRSEEEKIIAVLHDIVEKTRIELSDLEKNGFSGKIINAIDCLSKKLDEPYLRYIDRTKRNQLSKTVKIADLEDKIESTVSIEDLKDKTIKLKRYREALEILLKDS